MGPVAGLSLAQLALVPLLLKQSRLSRVLYLLGLGVMLLAKMEFDWHDATIILVLWLVQFVRPDMREEVAVAYALWMTILAIGFAVRGKTLLAPKYFWETVRK